MLALKQKHSQSGISTHRGQSHWSPWQHPLLLKGPKEMIVEQHAPTQAQSMACALWLIHGDLETFFRHAPCCHDPHPFTLNVDEHNPVSVRLHCCPRPLSCEHWTEWKSKPMLNLAPTDPEPHLLWTHTDSDTSLPINLFLNQTSSRYRETPKSGFKQV